MPFTAAAAVSFTTAVDVVHAVQHGVLVAAIHFLQRMLRVEHPSGRAPLHNAAKVGLLLVRLEFRQAERHLDDLVEELEAADARVEEDRLRHSGGDYGRE